MANKRAKGTTRPGPKKGSRATNANASTLAQRSRVKTLSSQDSTEVGRPGFRGTVPGPRDGKSRVRVLRQVDPAVGITQPGADIITDSHVDLVGSQNPKILSGSGIQQSFAANRRTVKTPRQSAPKKR